MKIGAPATALSEAVAMSQYVGLDVSQKVTHLSVVDRDGRVPATVSETRVGGWHAKPRRGGAYSFRSSAAKDVER